MKGKILPSEPLKLKFTYSAKHPVTSTLQFKLFISQFDFKPQNSILIGSSYHMHKQTPQIIEEQSKEYLRSKALLKTRKNLSLKSIKSKESDFSKKATSTIKIG